MTKPKVSVGMPVYNGEAYLGAAIDSVLCQSLGDLELIISDNASTDGTEEICRSYESKDKRIRLIRNERNLGAARNYNQVFEAALADYFRWANADDLSHPQLHELCADCLDQNPDAVLTYGKTQIIDAAGDVVEDFEDNLDLRQSRASDRFIRFYENFRLTNAIYGLMRTEALARTSLMGDSMSSDVQMMAELTLHGKFIEIPRRLFFRRVHEAAYSCSVELSKDEEEARQKQFWNPDQKGFALQTWRKHRNNLRAVSRARLGGWEKLRLRAHIGRMVYWEKSELTEELADFIKRKLA